MKSWGQYIIRAFKGGINGDTKPMSSSQKCEFLTIMFQRKQGPLKGLFFVVLVLQCAFMFMNVQAKFAVHTTFFWVYITRYAMVFLTAIFLAMACSDAVDQEEQKFLHSVLFDHHLERDGDHSQCHNILECFDAHAQRCQSQFSPRAMAFMRVMCISSSLHGNQSTISSARTRGLMMLLFLRFWPATYLEKEVILNVNKSLSQFGLLDRFIVYMRVAVNTSIMELAAWTGLMIYAHTTLSNSAVTATWNGTYDRWLRASNFSEWNVSRGQDPRYLNDLLFLMSDSLIACLAMCSMFPVPLSAFLILLLPVTIVVQISFLSLPDVIQKHQLNPAFIAQSQLFLLVSFFVLQRHNLFLLRSYRNDYLISFRQKLNFLPQGLDHAPSNAARDRMLFLAQRILSQMVTVSPTEPVEDPAAEPSLSLPGAVVLSAQPAASPLSSKRVAACSAISTLLSYLQNASNSRSQLCDVSEICSAAISQCHPLQKERQVDIDFSGRQRFAPLRVLIVDDHAFVRKCLIRLARDRGYYYESCCDGEACVKIFEATLQLDSSACNRFDLIIMDKEMPTADPSLSNTAGVSAVKKIRQLIKLHMEHDPRFKSPCIVGNSSCEESDASMVEFRNELRLMRLQAGMATTMLFMKEKMSSWSDGFDEEVRGLCGLNGEAELKTLVQPLVWGKPIRLQMLFRNLITNAIHHGKPASGRHHVRVSYDLIDTRARVHPCLVRSDQDDEVTRSLSWQLEDRFDEGTQRFVQIIVADNGPGIDANNERMKKRLGHQAGGSDARNDSAQAQAAPDAASAASSSASSVSNFGVCLRSIVCPEIANSHGAMGVHSRIEPTGCSFVIALPYFSPSATEQ